jgi:hypothetical protein
MNATRTLIVATILGCLTSISNMQLAQGQSQTEQSAEHQSPYILNGVVAPLNFTNQPGTDALQASVLTQINEAVVAGRLSAVEASEYKNQLNRLNQQESWYKTFNSPVPAALINKDTQLLNELSTSLNRKSVLTAKPETATHADVEQLINNALAHNRISSSEAEGYYLRLAQVESNLASVKGTGTRAADDQAAVNRTLGELKSELVRKTK